jgi:hypothetical protein
MFFFSVTCDMFGESSRGRDPFSARKRAPAEPMAYGRFGEKARDRAVKHTTTA